MLWRSLSCYWDCCLVTEIAVMLRRSLSCYEDCCLVTEIASLWWRLMSCYWDFCLVMKIAVLLFGLLSCSGNCRPVTAIAVLFRFVRLGRAAHEMDVRRRMISKNFHHVMKMSERQPLTGPPESMREHIVAASKAMKSGDWRACKGFIINEKMNAKVLLCVIAQCDSFLLDVHQRLSFLVCSHTPVCLFYHYYCCVCFPSFVYLSGSLIRQAQCSLLYI